MKVRLSGVTALLMAAGALQQVVIAYAGLAPTKQAAYACLAAWFAITTWLNDRD